MNPRPVERLEKTLARVAKEQGLAQERLRRWVSFLAALCGVLERAVSEGVLDNYYLKGGVAMELRFAEGARATKDIDIGVSGERTARLAALSKRARARLRRLQLSVERQAIEHGESRCSTTGTRHPVSNPRMAND